MFKVNATNLNSALDCAAVGGGKGFVLMVSPVKRKIAEDKVAQLASISSSDGEKTGLANLVIHTDDMKEDAIYYASSSLKPAVASLSKITDDIYVESKGAYLEVSDEKKESVVRVELLEKDVVLKLPDSPEGVTMIVMEREKFVNAIRLGGYAAQESHIAGIDVIGFQVNETEKKLLVASRRDTNMCKAVAPVKAIQNNAKESGTWHLVNFKFIQSMVQKLTGDMLQIAFNPKFMIVQSSTAMFGAKKSEGTIPASLIERLEDKSYDYVGTLEKKDLLLGIEIATVGIKDDYVTIETNENGTLNVTAMNSNKSVVVQKAHEGKMQTKHFYVDVLKLCLSGCGDELHYYGKVDPVFVTLDGTDAEVEYASMIAPMVPQEK